MGVEQILGMAMQVVLNGPSPQARGPVSIREKLLYRLRFITVFARNGATTARKSRSLTPTRLVSFIAIVSAFLLLRTPSALAVTPLADAVGDYVRQFLVPGRRLGE